jgi:large repetitive protein
LLSWEQVVANWATEISGGPNEDNQTVDFIVTSDNNDLFSAQPQLTPDGTLTYTPAAHAFGSATVTVKLHDDGGTENGGVDTGDPQTFQITVNAVNDVPVANDDTAQTDEDIPLVINDANTLAANDNKGAANENDQTLSVDQVSNPSHGTVDLQNGKITFTPDANYHGQASFDYAVCDDGTTNGQPDPKCDTGTLSVEVNPVNDVPVPVDNNYNTPEETPLIVGSPGLLANDTDVEQDTLRVADGNADTADGISPVSGPANGTVELHEDGSFTYKPNTNYHGTDSFDYRVCDNGSPEPQCSVQTATVNVTIDPVNDAPEAANDVNSTDEDTTLNVAAPGVLGNDSDFDDDPLTAVKVTDPAHGTLTLNADGSYNYKLQVVSSSCEELTLPFLVVVCWNCCRGCSARLGVVPSSHGTRRIVVLRVRPTEVVIVVAATGRSNINVL